MPNILLVGIPENDCAANEGACNLTYGPKYC
jgi:hypothetical protein